MKNFQFGKAKELIFVFIMLVISSFIFAGDPHIESVTMVPSSPTFGDAVQITITYCGQMYQDHRLAIAFSTVSVKDDANTSGTGQVFVVSRAGVDVATSQPALASGSEIGYVAQLNTNGGTADCPTCNSGSNDGKRYTKVYNVHVPPASYFPGCNVTRLYLHVGMKDNTIGAGEWIGLTACQSNPTTITWPIGTEAKNFSISKRVEGVLQAVDDLVLYSIDYEYWNGKLTVTDNIPGGGKFTLVSWGPKSFGTAVCTGPAIGSTSGAFSWALPDRTGVPGRATGTLWMLLKMNTALAAGITVSNNATGTMSGVAIQNAVASIVVGQAAITITKDQSEANPDYGDTITYYITYQVNGSKLVGYQPFDDIPIGTYGNAADTLTGTPPPGWNFNPESGTNGEWVIQDLCNTGDYTIRGDATNKNRYPSLLYNGLPSTNHMCKGIVMTDLMIEPNGYEGGDALVVIRSNGLPSPSGYAYGLVVSVDDYIGTNTGGNIGFQRCDSSCIWPSSVNSIAITANKWWRVKIEVGYPPANNQYAFRAKVWAKGDPEPGAWTISWTDPSPTSGYDCNNGQAWKPGIGEQHGADGDVSDYYNNFIVYEPRTQADTIIWDTVPNNSNNDVIYVGQQGPYTYTGNASVVSWSLGTISDEGGTFTWWGKVNTCNPITNDAWINGAAPMVANQSNKVIAYPVCPTPVITMHKTANPMTVNVGDKVTFELWACNSDAGPPTANPFNIWDDVPSYITFGGFDSAFPPVGSGTAHLTWTFPSVAAGACTAHVKWWGTVSGMPMINAEEYFAVIPDTKTTVIKAAFLAGYDR